MSSIFRKENGTNGSLNGHNANGQSKPTELKTGQAAPSGKGCPACNCFVYHADQVLECYKNNFQIEMDAFTRYSPRIRFTTNNASNVFAALGSSIQESPAMVQTIRFTAMVKSTTDFEEEEKEEKVVG